ncbi:MAG: AGE family epimerase/isomerase [Hyphomonadaceae bacterium]|nr:AGE family epimerase/isomerase [Hyphomonadaceae bacterium]
MLTLSPNARASLEALAREAREERLRITRWWARHSVDHARGGFHGAIGADNNAVEGADKAVVLNTRLLWFFSEAARLTSDPEITKLANRAADYVIEHFLDAKQGGLFWMADAAGQPIDRRKQAYAQAFGVYAFAAHYAATQQERSIDIAQKLFETLETRFLDRDGYWEARDAAFGSLDDVRLSERDLNAPLTMNTHLHALEAYARLYAVRPTAAVAEALARTIRILMRRVFDAESGHLRLFFDAEWRPIDRVISFGHDIEASWLLWEAAQALGEPELIAEARQCALRLAEATFMLGVGPHGEVFEQIDDEGRVCAQRVWWIQAEALVGFLNAFELSADQRFLDAAIKVWRFIRRYQIDPNAEWRAASALDESSESALMAGPWKCPYHTGRAMIEVERRAQGLLAGAAIPQHASRA